MSVSSSSPGFVFKALTPPFSVLDHRDIARLQLVSQRLLSISRDNELWKYRCFVHSPAEKSRRERAPPSHTFSLPTAANSRALNSAVERHGAPRGPPHTTSNQRSRSIADWGLAYPQEKTNWYREYVSRYGPISVGWLQQPIDAEGKGSTKREMLGMGLLRDSASTGEPRGTLVVAPLDDRSVCLWDVTTADHSKASVDKGRAIARSKAGLLTSGTNRIARSSHLPHNDGNNQEAGIVECVSVDSLRKRGYFAVGSCLNEVDLETLRIVAETPYPSTISALSEIRHPVPLTVGTNSSLHIHDSRLTGSHDGSCPWEGKCESTPQTSSVEKTISHAIKSLETGHSKYAQLLQPGPVSIMHLAETGGSWGNSSIYVAGRFSSILDYDRRFFPRLRGTIYSGARLSNLTSLDHPLVPTDRRDEEVKSNGGQHAQSSGQMRAPSTKTLIACGEYNGKGSLEFYGLGSGNIDSLGSDSGFVQTATYKNRQTASSSKLLSVVNHGTRLLFSDGDGTLKWMERDGFTEVRRWNINQGRLAEPRGLFAPASGAANGDVVRKILPNNDISTTSVHHDELLLWTGERIALLNFSKRPAFLEEQFEEAAESDDEAIKLREEMLYGEAMRRALERQADEARFVQGLGLGTNSL